MRSYMPLFVVLPALVVSSAVGVAQAALISAYKDSSQFSYQYTGADLYDGNGWTPMNSANTNASKSGDSLLFSPWVNGANGAGYYGWDLGSQFDDSVGFTIEFQFKITTKDTTGYGPFGMNAGDGGTNQYNVHGFPWNKIQYANPAMNDTTLYTGDFTDRFYTYRIAEPSYDGAFNGGTGDTHTWLDGQLLRNDLTGYQYSIETIRWGCVSGYMKDGQVQLEYIRIDVTGGYTPVVPEPSSLVLLLLGGGLTALVWRRRRA